MNCKLEFGEACNIGLIRTNNEDAILSSPDNGLWLIADGMGGHDAGEIASQIVKDSVLESIRNGKKLKEAIEKSHFDVKHAAANNIGSPNMGTTIVALLNHGSHYQIGWVGDSRAYLWSANDSMLRQISKDHSYVQALVDAGTISKADMDTHPQRNIITQSLGVSELESVAVDILDGEWHPGDKILLCSDGLTDLVSDSEIAHLFRKHRHQSNQALVDILINTALDKGGIDNVSVQIISAPEHPSAMQDPVSAKHRHLAGLIFLGTVLSAGLIWLLAR